MSIKYDKDFFIFENKRFINFNRLNDAGLRFYALLDDICKDPDKKADFYNNVKSIVVTSQDRTKRNSNHNNGQAIDLTVYPAGMNVWLFKEFREYSNTIYISSHNRHLHFDLREQGLSGVEVLNRNGRDYYPQTINELRDTDEIKIIPIDTVINYIFKWYDAHKLPALKINILIGLNMPFIGAKKTGQHLRFKAEEFYKENVSPAIDKFLLIAGGLVVFLLLKNSGGKNVIIYKEKH